ncbi:ubiquinone anaerobic biosynthesis protein UbiU [Magnetospirillum fulvum]|uniref:Ubiquinone biosynthesis protein UbiU n=1 Tax=Magnetospirillum fulvum MGU-K5 TaxID=1316936 RepID=S9SAD0_MAGFU|nr:peptidase U32 family protein [Magnetospirillum fulvum]EPY01013.1 putative protease yhbU precursor [Magnetospirillum fulvum MGU-K5]
MTTAQPAPAPLTRPELVCPAGTPAALKSAIDAGADTVYVGFRDETNARNFPGLNFNRRELAEGIEYAHSKGAKVLVAVNTFPRAGHPEIWHKAVADCDALKADAVILADIGLIDHAARHHPNLRLHLSVQAAASNPDAIRFYAERYGIKRVVLPRVLTVQEIAEVNARIAPIETEVFVFGGLCVMAEGRCALSSYATGQSPNINGACSPASDVRYTETSEGITSELGGFTINKFAHTEPAGYPTLCKGRFIANEKSSYLFEEPTSLNTLAILPDLIRAGVTAFKIEGRQRGRAYVSAVVRAFREGVDAVMAGKGLPDIDLDRITEGGKQTTGAYEKAWR